MQQTNQQYNQAPQQIPQGNAQEYGQQDTIQNYGSIIKDLTETDEMLNMYELKLRGKKKDASGNIIEDTCGEQRMKTDRAARDFVDLLRSIVNRHNDFSYYDAKTAYALLGHLNYTICRWLMFQGEEVPLRYRFKISTEAMNMANASVFKAVDGKMLHWTKGTFSEGMQRQDGGEKRGIMDMIFNRRKKTNYGG